MEEQLKWIEAAMGAVSKINADVSGDDLLGARCPTCNSEHFVKVADLYFEAAGRLEEGVERPSAEDTGGMTDRQIVAKFTPPRRKSVTGVVIAVAIPLAVLDFYLYRRVSALAGQGIIIASAVIVVIVLMTSIRRLSDQYYHRRRRWNSLFMCRKCAQLVASSN